MWKPGTNAPPSSSVSSSSQVEYSSPVSANAVVEIKAQAIISKKKQLSGSTMGMRFMQRKKEATKAADQKQREEKIKAEQGSSRVPTNQQKEVMVGMDSPTSSANKNTTLTSEEEMTKIWTIIPEAATASDMYGIGADIIGRRSFGGFHPTVAETWATALRKREEEETSSRDGMEHISDEELLRRYEQYVKGGGDSIGGIDKAAAAPIGNLKDKLRRSDKRKRS